MALPPPPKAAAPNTGTKAAPPPISVGVAQGAIDSGWRPADTAGAIQIAIGVKAEQRPDTFNPDAGERTVAFCRQVVIFDDEWNPELYEDVIIWQQYVARDVIRGAEDGPVTAFVVGQAAAKRGNNAAWITVKEALTDQVIQWITAWCQENLTWNGTTYTVNDHVPLAQAAADAQEAAPSKSPF